MYSEWVSAIARFRAIAGPWFACAISSIRNDLYFVIKRSASARVLSGLPSSIIIACQYVVLGDYAFGALLDVELDYSGVLLLRP